MHALLGGLPRAFRPAKTVGFGVLGRGWCTVSQAGRQGFESPSPALDLRRFYAPESWFCGRTCVISSELTIPTIRGEGQRVASRIMRDVRGAIGEARAPSPAEQPVPIPRPKRSLVRVHAQSAIVARIGVRPNVSNTDRTVVKPDPICRHCELPRDCRCPHGDHERPDAEVGDGHGTTRETSGFATPTVPGADRAVH